VNNRTALFLTFDLNCASFRHRLVPSIERLKKDGWECNVERLVKKKYILRILQLYAKHRKVDLLVLSKIQPFHVETDLLKHFAKKIVLDFDDAIYLRMPRNIGSPPGESRLRWAKFARACKVADLVVAGNRFLAGEALRFTDKVEIIPTPVDVSMYPPEIPLDRQWKTLVWIGLPENLMYLEMLRPVISELVKKHPEMSLRVICSRFPDWGNVPIERIIWSRKTEVDALRTAGIGLMPLVDDSWTRGKCAFKLLQYMAASLPCVASPVGVNSEVVIHGVTGYHAGNLEEWACSVDKLLGSSELCRTMGEKGREYVSKHYSTGLLSDKIVSLLLTVVDR
jgi:glycosyltransferase involved in cell wall biosynthesis